MKRLSIVLVAIIGSLVPVAAASAYNPLTEINKVCGPVNVYGVSPVYKAKYCAAYAFPTGTYWVKYCAKHAAYCSTL